MRPPRVRHAPGGEPCCRPCARAQRSQAAYSSPVLSRDRTLLVHVLARWAVGQTHAELLEIHDRRCDRDAPLLGRIVGVRVATDAVGVVVVVAQDDFEVANRNRGTGVEQCREASVTGIGMGSPFGLWL